MAETDDRIEAVARTYDVIYHAVQHAAAPLLADSGLTLAQLRILFIMQYRGPVCMGELAERLDIGLPTASYHVEKLVAAGLVERFKDKSDRRTVLIQLTPVGVETVTRFERRRLDQLGAWLVQLTPEELDKLGEGLGALANIIKAAYDATSPPDQGD